MKRMMRMGNMDGETKKLEYGTHRSKKQPPRLLDNEHHAITAVCESHEGYPPRTSTSTKLRNLYTGGTGSQLILNRRTFLPQISPLWTKM